MLGIFWGIMLFQFGGLILPGPDFAIVFRHSILKGTRDGFFCAFGVAAGVMFNLIITFFIGTLLYNKYHLFYLGFISIGVAFLYYISLSLIRNFFKLTKPAEIINDVPATKLAGNSFITGFITNLSNAKAIVFFSTLLPLVNQLNTTFTLLTWFGMGIMAWAWFSLVVILFGNNKIRHAFLAKMHICELVIGIAIFIFATAIFYTTVLCYFL